MSSTPQQLAETSAPMTETVEPSAPITPEVTEDAQTPAEAPTEAPGPTPADCARELKQLFPALFDGAPKPLKLRIQVDIQARTENRFTKKLLSVVLSRYTGATPYLIALTRATHRFDLDGQPVAELSEEHRQAALEELNRRRALNAERRAQERAQQRPARGPRANNTNGAAPDGSQAAGATEGQAGAEASTNGSAAEAGNSTPGAEGGAQARPPRTDRRPPRGPRPAGDRPAGERPAGERGFADRGSERNTERRGGPRRPDAPGATRGEPRSGARPPRPDAGPNGRTDARPQAQPEVATTAELTPEQQAALQAERAARQAAREAERAAREAQHAAQAALANDPERRQRASLLRDFERTTLTPANFCALKGLNVAKLDEQLALARKEAADAPARAPEGQRANERHGDRPQERGHERTNERHAQRPHERGGERSADRRDTRPDGRGGERRGGGPRNAG